MKLDFFKVSAKYTKDGIELYPTFLVKRSNDLMVRGKSFYAVWDENRQLWSTDEYDVQRLVDAELYSEAEAMQGKTGSAIVVKSLGDYSNGMWTKFKRYVSDISDSLHVLDEKLTFQDTKVKKTDYISKRLPYALSDGDCSAYDELIGTLYEPEERQKLEWAIGSVVTGDARDIQKFVVLYGEAGAGKSTVLNIIQQLFQGYYTTFDAKALTSNNNAFSTEVFRSNPLVAIQHDGDLSRIEDNTKLNSIVSHEEMPMNEKYKAGYTARLNCFLFMASNKPVKITDAKSGIIRRLIDVKPSGKKIPAKHYFALMETIPFELGAIATHCKNVFQELGKNAYQTYRPVDMMYKTDLFFNFVEDQYVIFRKEDGTTLKSAYTMYKNYCDESGAEFKLPMYKFREELKNYFRNFEDVARIDGKQYRSYYSGFLTEKFERNGKEHRNKEKVSWLVMDQTESKLDILLAECKAQLANAEEKPTWRWSNVKSRLKDLNTKELHYVKPDIPGFVVADFDLKDENGNKSAKLNREAAEKWKPTYAEYSKSGEGIHLHYIYDGDVSQLQTEYAPGIEIKTFPGNASLRRKLSACNGYDISHLSGGLPVKECKKVIKTEVIKNERMLRKLIEKNLNKEVHADTSSSVDFIFSLLEEARQENVQFDVTDLRPAILAFAAGSTNQAERCVDVVSRMIFRNPLEAPASVNESPDDYLIFFDVEVFPNLFVVCWKRDGENYPVVSMINPSPNDISELAGHKLVGFNCRKYDNHILYARMLGYTEEQLYELSKRIIGDSPNSFFQEAYNLSYTDIFDFCSEKQSLKMWEIELKIHHQELGLPWNEPVEESKWEQVAEYCKNDVIATEAVFHAREMDFNARKILTEICKAVGQNATVNDTTNQLTTKLILRGDRKASKQFVYPDLKNEFPGYEFNKFGIDRERYSDPAQIVKGKSIYHGIDPGEGGYVYAKPGTYRNVITYDVASMHPSSIIAENGFGEYTKNLKELLDIRLKIKHKEFDSLKELYNGALAPYLGDEKTAKQLSFALKIAINSVYGLTAAHFDNAFRDIRNEDNWVAKRGALFMIDLRLAVESMGGNVVHVKTDSIKVENPSKEIEDYILKKGREFGYTFEIEEVYERFCLVNDAVYISKTADGKWAPKGKPFVVPYVLKSLFTKENIGLEDLTETFNVTTALYLDFNEELPDVSGIEKEIKKLNTKLRKAADPGEIAELKEAIEEKKKEAAKGHHYIFVGKAGEFCPVKKGCGGGLLMREKDGGFSYAGGAAGYRWKEAEIIKSLGKEEEIDRGYFEEIAGSAMEAVNEWGDYDQLVAEDDISLSHGTERTARTPTEMAEERPWYVPCGDYRYAVCTDCPECHGEMCQKGYLLSSKNRC